MTVSIVIPVYNALEYTRACLESIFSAGASVPFEIIVVDNGSSGDVRVWLREFARGHANLKALHFEEPLGFARAVNQGARAAGGEFLVILNSDTLVTGGWLDSLHDALRRYPDLGVVSPVTNRCGHPLQADREAADLAPQEAESYAERIRSRSGIQGEAQRLAFFCVMIRRALWEQLGGLDEVYGQGNFEDDDFCARTRLLGRRLAVLRNTFVFHHERRTFDANRLKHGETLARNQETFLARLSRWSREPGSLAGPPTKASRKTSILLPVPPDCLTLALDSLRSLANQTVGPFEVLAISSGNVADKLCAAKGSLTLRTARVPAERGGNLAVLLNEGMKSVQGDSVAFCPAGDIWFPFHLELLAGALDDGAEAAYTAWCFEAADRTVGIRFDQAEPERITTGDWIPLASWISAAPHALPRFDEALDNLMGWAFACDMIARAQPAYLRRISCRKMVRRTDAAEAARVLERISGPRTPWHEEERRQFLRAAASGSWESALILQRNEVERRARMLFAPPQRLAANPRELERCATRLRAAATAGSLRAAEQTAAPDILLFSILGWADLTQRPHHFARGLARAGHRVFWIDVALKAPETMDSANLAGELERNLYRVELPAVPGELYNLQWHASVVDAMEAAFLYLKSAFRISPAVQFVNFPKWWPLVERLAQAFRWPIVYDCLDDQHAFGMLHPNNDADFEPALIDAAAVLVTSGRSLYEKHRRHANRILIPNAADYDLFSQAEPAGLLDYLPHPIAGFFGAFSEWLDREWIAAAARRFPDWSFVYIGREGFARAVSRKEWQAATSAPNIHLFPQTELPALARYLAEFDVCIMPFRDLPITRSMNAVKLYEYLAAGKPVVVPDLPETRPMAEAGLLDVYTGAEQSFELLERAVREGRSPARVEAQRRFAAANQWEDRVGQLRALLPGLSR